MSALQRLFMGQIFPDKAKKISESNSNVDEDNRKMAKLSKRPNTTTSNCASSSYQEKMALNLQPVQHDIEQFSTDYNDLFNSEEARIRIGRLVEKQKKAHALSQLKSSTDDQLLPAESHQVHTRSFSNIADLNSNRSGRDKGVVSKESTESNSLKRKVVLCQKVPSYKGFSGTSAASNSSQKDATNDSSNNSVKKAKEENKTKVCETSKEFLNKNTNIQSLNEGKRLIRQHIQQSKQSNSSQQVASRQSPSVRSDRSPPRKYSSPTRPSKVPRIVQESESVQEAQTNKELTTQKHDVHTNQTPGVANKEDSKERKQNRSTSKTKKEQKKVSPPGLNSEKEVKLRKRTYNQDEIRKYISRQKEEAKKHKHDQRAIMVKKRWGKNRP